MLELQSAVLSTSSVVIKDHDYIIDSTYYWTDSSIVFQWIRGVSKRHPAFDANIEPERSWTAPNPINVTTVLDS